MITFTLGFLVGFIAFPLFIAWRAMRSDHWDNSNLFNVLRILSMIATHPDIFGEVYREDGTSPFWWIKYDEFKDVVKVEPKHDH